MRFPFQRPTRLLIAIPLVLLLAAAVIIGAVLWWSLPSTRQTAAIPGLSAPVEIGFDQDGVPRIHAASALDAAAALGFVHARDRMFQMDLMRRNASGRLSEIAGPVTLRLDRTMRVLGLRRRAGCASAKLASAGVLAGLVRLWGDPGCVSRLSPRCGYRCRHQATAARSGS